MGKVIIRRTTLYSAFTDVDFVIDNTITTVDFGTCLFDSCTFEAVHRQDIEFTNCIFVDCKPKFGVFSNCLFTKKVN